MKIYLSLTLVLCIAILALTPVLASAADEMIDHDSSDQAGGGLLEAMGLNPKLIIIQAAGFLIVLLVLKTFVFGKVGGILDDRQKEIVSRMDKLENDQSELDRLTSETQQRLNEIEAEARTKVQEAVERGELERQQILEQGRQEAAAQIEHARSEIQRDKDAAILELRGQIAEIAISAASQVIDQQLDQATHQHIIDEYVSRLPEAPNV